MDKLCRNIGMSVNIAVRASHNDSAFPSSLPLKEFELPEIFLMTSHLDSHTTTDVKLDILSDVKIRN